VVTIIAATARLPDIWLIAVPPFSVSLAQEIGSVKCLRAGAVNALAARR
jgi:hypothetical protein